MAKTSFPRISIRSALVVVVLVALLPCLFVIVAFGRSYAAHAEEHASSDILRNAVAFGDIQASITEASREMLVVLAAREGLRDADPDRVETVLKRVHEANADYLNITCTDAKGFVVASSKLPRGTDVSARPHIRRALETGRFCVGEYVVGLVGAEPSIAFSIPVFGDGGAVRGTLSAVYRLSSYAERFERFALPDDSFLGILDRNGARLFFYPPKETNPVGERVKESVWEKIRAIGEIGGFVDTGSDGIERFFGFRAVKLEGDDEPYAYVVCATPRELVLAASREITVASLAIAMLSGAMALALAAGMAHFLFGRRLARIGVAAARVGAGQLSARADLGDDSSDLGRIGAAFDLMAAEVERRDKERSEEAARLNRMLVEKRILLKELHHRVKNNLQVVMSLIRLQEGTRADDESLKELDARISAMAMVHEMLYSSDDFYDLDLRDYCERLHRLLRSSWGPERVIDARLSCEEIRCPLDKAIPFGLLFSELVANSWKHAFRDGSGGRMDISLSRVDGIVRLVVSDDGPGLPAGFDMTSSKGLGLQLVAALSAQLGGSVSWETGAGARFIVDFPAVAFEPVVATLSE